MAFRQSADTCRAICRPQPEGRVFPRRHWELAQRRATQQSQAAPKTRPEEECRVIQAYTKFAGADTHCGDETGLRSDDVRARSVPPAIRVHNKRHSLRSSPPLQERAGWDGRPSMGRLSSEVLIDLRAPTREGLG